MTSLKVTSGEVANAYNDDDGDNGTEAKDRISGLLLLFVLCESGTTNN